MLYFMIVILSFNFLQQLEVASYLNFPTMWNNNKGNVSLQFKTAAH